jgi:hypothetical protein
MATKVFKTLGNLELIGDERDVMVPARHRLAVLDWCDANDIAAEITMGSTHSAWSASTFGVNLWRVKDEQQRVLFLLRWA